MVTITPSSFVLSGSGFTPNGDITVLLYNSAGTEVFASAAGLTAPASGNLSITEDSSIFEALGTAAGTYTGYMMVYNNTTSTGSNKVSVNWVVAAAQALSPQLSFSANPITLNTNFSIIVSGMVPNGTWKLVDAANDTYIFGNWQPLDGSGNGNQGYFVSPNSPLWMDISNNQSSGSGSLNVYAVDSAGNKTPTETINGVS